MTLSPLFLLGGLPSSVQAAGKTYTNSIGVEFVLIPAGSFMMGTDRVAEEEFDNETPQHKVNISKPFYLGKYEVTQRQWTAVMDGNPSHFRGGSKPVEHVSWDDVQEFVLRLNQKEGHKRYRLPTEAEWEYAARAGTTSTWSFGEDASQLGQYAWCNGNSGDKTHPVGQKQPNPWGLYDIYGSVYEWVQDWYGEQYYSGSPSSDPRGPSSGLGRVLRGGDWGSWDGDWLWGYAVSHCRSAFRGGCWPGRRSARFGFRLVLSPE
jgi:formylglycine-generating enzyme required for sulfatase activity